MTIIDTAAAWRTLKLVTFAASTTIIGATLSGCGTTTAIFPTSADGGSPLAAAATTPKATTPVGTAKIAIAPVIGAPDVIAKHLSTELRQALAASNIPVAASPSETVAYTLRGYVVSAREQANTKISYIWDVTDASGKRVNRITGEEVAKTASGADPWSAMTPQVVKAISSKTATSLATWLPSQLNAAAAPAAIASAAAGGITTAANTASQAVTNTANAVAPTGPTTGSIHRPGAITAIIPNVTGAPGDGGVSLSNAIRRELARKGVTMASAATPTAYRVVGNVKMGLGAQGKQPIAIDWQVQDPTGKKVGEVTQKNNVPQGSLNGAWGKTADMVAAAATHGIMELLAKQKKTN